MFHLGQNLDLFRPFRPVSAGKLVSAGILFGPLVFIFFFSVLSQPTLSLFYSKTFVGFGFWVLVMVRGGAEFQV